MDEETEKLHLQNIEEYVFDETKIVTYKWLSKALGLHVNTAKQLLYTFATENAQKTELQITYLVGGLLPDGHGYGFQVVPKDSLEKVKAQFQVVTSEHMYSVHKSKKTLDVNMLYCIDRLEKDEDLSKIQRAVHCKQSILRPEENLFHLKLKARFATACADEKQWPKGKPSVANKQPSSEELPLATKTTKMPGAIATMFAAQSSKSKPDSVKTNTTAKAGVKNKAGSGIAMFFNRQANKPKPCNGTENPMASAVTKASSSKPEATSDNHDSGIKSDSKSDSQESLLGTKEVTETNNGEHILELPSINVNTNKDNKNSKENSQRGSVKDKKPSKLDGDKGESKSRQANVKTVRKKNNKSQNVQVSQPEKKRKRILIMADSESSDDDIFGTEDEAPESPFRSEPEPEPEPESNTVSYNSDSEYIIPSTPQQQPNKWKRKRKVVDKIFDSGDGYIVTKKEFVFEDCSDSEVEEKECESIEDKKSLDKKLTKSVLTVGTTDIELPKKNVSPQKAKQTTLKNFFKKN